MLYYFKMLANAKSDHLERNLGEVTKLRAYRLCRSEGLNLLSLDFLEENYLGGMVPSFLI